MENWKLLKRGWEKYHAYLASREWAILKKAVKARSKGICEACYCAEGTETHHNTYIRLFREQVDDLRHVCRECHMYLSAESDFDPAKHVDPLFDTACAECGELGDLIGRTKNLFYCPKCSIAMDDKRRIETAVKAGAA